MKTVKVVIVSGEAEIYSDFASMVILPGQMGELGITPRHSPLLTMLAPGEIRVVQQDEIEVLVYVSGGYVEVQPHIVTVLADMAMRAENIDEERANSAREKAEQIIADGATGISYAQARAELETACAQLRTLDDLRKRRRKTR